MKSPFVKTALMGLLAVILSAIAAAVYPWPETIVENDLVGRPLVEPYDASAVRSISIIKYDPDHSGLDRIEIRRSGEQWIIPAHKNFVATNASQIGLAINSLTGNVLETRSSDQQDHVEYGVVDPLEFETTTNRGSLGTKIVLEDRNNRELASLIVGDSPRGEPNGARRKHFVRIPGQPNVYVMEIPSDALTTHFTRWVSSNLLGLSEEIPVESITIKNYRIPSDELIKGKKNWNYEILVDAKNAKRTLRVSAGDDQAAGNELVEAEVTDQMIGPLREIGNYIGNIVFTDVQKKSAAAASALKKRVTEKSAELDSLIEFGLAAIEPAADHPFGLQFNAVGGEVVVQTADGVALSVLIGSIVDNPSAAVAASGLNLNHNVMLYARVDEGAFPMPAQPAGSDDLEAEQNEAEKKVYLRLLAAREKKLKSALQRAAELNQIYADWYFIVSEQVINGFRPELTIPPVLSGPAEAGREPTSAGRDTADSTAAE